MLSFGTSHEFMFYIPWPFWLVSPFMWELLGLCLHASSLQFGCGVVHHAVSTSSIFFSHSACSCLLMLEPPCYGSENLPKLSFGEISWSLLLCWASPLLACLRGQPRRKDDAPERRHATPIDNSIRRVRMTSSKSSRGG